MLVRNSLIGFFVLLGLSAAGVAQAAEAPPGVPESVTNWFASKRAVAAFDELMGSDAEWRTELLTGDGKVAMGRPVVSYALAIPEFDLKAEKPSSGTSLADNLLDSDDEYCARVFQGDIPRDAVLCVEMHKDGTIEPTEMGGVVFLDAVGDLPPGGIAETGYGYFGVDKKRNTAVALDSTARTNVGVAKVDGGDLTAAMGRRSAELAAVARINGPMAGGIALPLMGDTIDKGFDTEWQEQVARGLAIPDDEVWQKGDPERVEQVEDIAVETAPASTKVSNATGRGALGDQSGARRGSLVGAAVIMVALFAGLLGARRSLRNRRRRALDASGEGTEADAPPVP